MSSSPPISPDTIITTSSGPAPRDTCLDRCVLIGFLSIIFLAFATVITVALVFSTDVKDPQFQVDSIMISPLNLSSNVDRTRSHWSIGILVRNPTKFYHLEYQKFYVLVLYNKTEFVTGITVEPFHQRPKNKTKIVVQTEAALLDGVDRKGVVSFDLELQVNSIYLFGQDRRQYSWFDVLCGNLKVEFSSHASNGTMVGGARQCSTNGG